jgi:hypothetical protein
MQLREQKQSQKKPKHSNSAQQWQHGIMTIESRCGSGTSGSRL